MSSLASRGDTIIEVLLAVTVFSAVSVMAMQLMQSGTNSAQRTLEITHVKQQIDAQADALRAAQQAYMFSPEKASVNDSPEQSWKEITASSTLPSLAVDTKCPEGTDYNGTFYMNPKTASKAPNQTVGFNVDNAPLYAQVAKDPSGNNLASYGVWIEKHPINGSNNAADFYVRACWYAPGASLPMQLQTIVRLNYGN